jgi:hypothetical protein
MTVRPAGRHNHGVGDRGFASEIDGYGVLSLHVIETGEDQADYLLGVGARLGDSFGGAARASPRECRCCQGSFPFAASGAKQDVWKIGMAG